jgi:hypothetical protein
MITACLVAAQQELLNFGGENRCMPLALPVPLPIDLPLHGVLK